MTGLPDKIGNGQLGLPVWKPERVFNLSAIDVNIEDTQVGDSPESGRTYTDPVTVQLWVADTKEDDYYCVASATLEPGKHRAFALCGFVNAFGFEEVVRLPATAQVVMVTDAHLAGVSEVAGVPFDSDTRPQVDIKPLGTFL